MIEEMAPNLGCHSRVGGNPARGAHASNWIPDEASLPNTKCLDSANSGMTITTKDEHEREQSSKK
jgi:hypothetical protein